MSAGESAGARAAKRHLGNGAFQQIRKDILHCVLRPGAQVSEHSLAERYGLGKGPIRYALAQLNQTGLIRTVPRRGYVIAPITLEDVFELLDRREIIEPAAARRAAGRVDAAQLRSLDNIYAKVPVEQSREDHERMMLVNRTIHVAIAVATGNRWIQDVVIQTLDSMERILRFAWAERQRTGRRFHGHQSLIDALERGDADAAEALAAEHVGEARSVIMTGLLSRSGAAGSLIIEK